MVEINVITLFPQIISNYVELLPFKRAIEKGVLKVNVVNLRDFAVDTRGTVDDKPYGGGVGMILMPEPIYKALESLGKTPKENLKTTDKVILTAPSGKLFTQKTAETWVENNENSDSSLTFICGRYEGVDARVGEHMATDILSVGEYVLSGGELPALTMMEAVTRLLPGAIEKPEAIVSESFSSKIAREKEYPQYTRPADFNGHKVPEVLLSGHHGKIDAWRK